MTLKKHYQFNNNGENIFNQNPKPMYKQNLGFIAPFALNILAYVMIWHFFFRDTDTIPSTDPTPTPIVNIDNNTAQEPAEALLIAGENHFTALPSEENQ